MVAKTPLVTNQKYANYLKTARLTFFQQKMHIVYLGNRKKRNEKNYAFNRRHKSKMLGPSGLLYVLECQYTF